MYVETQVDQQAVNAYGLARLALSYLDVSLVYLGLSCRGAFPVDSLACLELSCRGASLACPACTFPVDSLVYLELSCRGARLEHQERLSVGAQPCYA